MYFRVRRFALFAVAALAAAVGATPTWAAPINSGDIFIGLHSGGLIQHRNSAGVLLETLNTGQNTEQTGMAFDAAGNLYTTNFGASNMTRFSAANTAVSSLFATNDANSHNESIAFDMAGNMYIGQPDGTADIIKRNAAGNFVARYNGTVSPRGTDWVDLAADQHTLFYTSEGATIRRFDTTTNTQLADFASVAGAAFVGMRLLGDGGLLVADFFAAGGFDVRRLDSSGNLVTGYNLPGSNFFALNLDPDGTHFWTANYTTGDVYKVNIATGAVDLTFNDLAGGASGLAIAGELTQGSGNANGVPAPGAFTLASLGLACLGAYRRKLRRSAGPESSPAA